MCVLLEPEMIQLINCASTAIKLCRIAFNAAIRRIVRIVKVIIICMNHRRIIFNVLISVQQVNIIII